MTKHKQVKLVDNYSFLNFLDPLNVKEDEFFSERKYVPVIKIFFFVLRPNSVGLVTCQGIGESKVRALVCASAVTVPC
jgi:hypothetical protein